jgi:hypothetical protein
VRWNDILLDFPQPSTFTAADLLRILPALRAEPAGVINPANRDYAVRNIHRSKGGENLSDPLNAPPSALQITAGVQRELGSQIDYNRYLSESGRVIRKCEESERNDVHAVCSNGPIMFDTTSGRARYAGQLLHPGPADYAHLLFRPQPLRVLVFGEVFNLFNTANLVQYNGDLLNRATFGQPGARFTQIVGSGGPRAFQLGARVSF